MCCGAGYQARKSADLMIPDDDPLWYDHAEPDEAPGFTVWVLIGAFAAVTFIRASTTALFRALRIGLVAAFRDVKP